ncbi:MAG: hypothetical protein H0T18_08210 [Chloroflexia bacterium]|nr:hypothetical protein [Chloroflexia bacterium]
MGARGLSAKQTPEMERHMELGFGTLVIVLFVTGLAIWRINRVMSWRALAMTARATGSLRECVSLFHFCARN